MFTKAKRFLSGGRTFFRPCWTLFRLILIGVTLAVIFLVAACSGETGEVTDTNGPATQAVETSSEGEVSESEVVEVTRVVEEAVEVPGENFTPVGSPLNSTEMDAFASLIDNSPLSGVISSGDIDMSSAYGLLLSEGQTIQGSIFFTPDNDSDRSLLARPSQQLDQFGLVGAVTNETINAQDRGSEDNGVIIGVLNVNVDDEYSVFARELYLISIDMIEDPPPDPPNLYLKYQSGDSIFPGEIGLLDRSYFELEANISAFRYTIGSHTCYICPWFLSTCISFKCPHW